uniref:ORF71 n=1 Tax=Malaco herpesvirus 4 TaxID=3031800 RepID=A0AA48P7Q0_9VIRU|nr:TPA_asm: ORF71 [Malaco herpesvirus 4]
MTTVDNGQVDALSSHRNAHDKSDIVLKVDDVRSKHVCCLSVEYVCKGHIEALLKGDTDKCRCNFFKQPTHMKTRSEYREVLDMFTYTVPGSGDTTISNKNALLSEIGILPKNVNTSAVGSSELDLTLSNLTTLKARRYTTATLFPLIDYINGTRSDFYICKNLFAYVDPAPFESRYSKNSICIMVRASNNIPNAGRDTLYIVVAVEDFKSSEVDAVTMDSTLANSKRLITMLTMINIKYNGYFNDIVVAPEANSFSMEAFKHRCAQLFFDSALLPQALTAHMTTYCVGDMRSDMTEIKRKRIAELSERTAMKRRIKEEGDLSKTILSVWNHESTDLDYFSRGSMKDRQRIRSYTNDNKNAAVRNLFMGKELNVAHVPMVLDSNATHVKLRIGFKMDRNKVSYCVNFFSRVFNECRLMFADTVLSMSLANKSVSVSQYVVDQLAGLQIRRKGCRGGYEITGKKRISKENRTGDGDDHIRDDCAISLIMTAVVLDMVMGGQGPDLVKLMPPGQDTNGIVGNTHYEKTIGPIEVMCPNGGFI